MENKIFNEFLSSGNTTISNLLIKNYRKLRMTEKDLIIYLNLLMFSQQGIQFPRAALMADHTGYSEEEVYNTIQNLIKIGIIDLKTVIENHQQRDIYDLTPVFERINTLLEQNENHNQHQKLLTDTQELFKKIEVEFGRPISPIEQEQVHQWIDDDHFSLKLIDLALRETVLNQAYSLKYMDRILISWEKSNIKTADQLQERRKKLGY
ncbi:DnaD domain protein [Companilactobacillus mishanensis]|uniref:DnaD domain protein n=1 Tax=Companilactobacillus mishanensis TaxID=2486008 RepID=A0A5P0ZEX8_9LACO|nr:DnaD domain protein [Companilactobacillus mishanensis]MQS51604.1 DnaD domain protein [Companilactobacillus mishanensis]